MPNVAGQAGVLVALVALHAHYAIMLSGDSARRGILYLPDLAAGKLQTGSLTNFPLVSRGNASTPPRQNPHPTLAPRL